MKQHRRTALATLAVTLAAATAAAAPIPRIFVADAQRDLGEVQQGTVLELEYRIDNPGDAPLELEVRPTCGCTVVDADRRITANSSGYIRARIDTKGFSGPITKNILVISNDPETPSLRLVARANVTRTFEVLPRPLVRLHATVGDGAGSTVTIAPTDGRDFTITGIDGVPAWLEATYRRLPAQELAPGRGRCQYEVGLHLTNDAQPGFVDTRLVIRTDRGDSETIELKVIGVVSAT